MKGIAHDWLWQIIMISGVATGAHVHKDTGVNVLYPPSKGKRKKGITSGRRGKQRETKRDSILCNTIFLFDGRYSFAFQLPKKTNAPPPPPRRHYCALNSWTHAKPLIKIIKLVLVHLMQYTYSLDKAPNLLR